MSDTLVIEGTDDASRRVGRRGEKVDPALAAVTEQLKTAEAEKTRLGTVAAGETERANEAAKTALEATKARIEDAGRSLDLGLSTAEAALKTARAAKLAATEAGNHEAAQAADEGVMEAMVNIRLFKDKKREFEAEKPRLIKEAEDAAKPRAPVKTQTSEAAQWQRDHPRFNAAGQEAYTEQAAFAQGKAAAQGMAPGTAQSLRFIDSHLETLFGKDHHQLPGDKSVRTNERGESVTVAAGPGRDTEPVFTMEGVDLRLGTNAKGEKTVSGRIPAQWVEAAGWCGMDPVEYAVQMLEHQSDLKSGKAVYANNGMTAIYR